MKICFVVLLLSGMLASRAFAAASASRRASAVPKSPSVQLARLFSRYLKEDGSGKEALLSAIRRLPYYAAMDKFPERAVEYRKLELGVRLAPDIVRARVAAAAAAQFCYK
ncbi:MAG: hypothetical protein HKL90_00925 [Elusimicrobia bacterium]|nr:hypothetical protein [Elusimicrobiota bacterium]